MNFANNKRFGHSQLGAPLPHPGFSKKTLTKYLQLYLPYSGDSQFGNGIIIALGLSGLAGSSGSLYP